MKKLFLFAAAATMFAACSKDTTEDINVLPDNIQPHDVLQVSVGDEDESRIQLDNGKTVWTQGDKVSVFYKTTGNECYQFTGNTGDTRGSIMKVSGSAGATAIDKNIVIYPYNKDYELDLMNNTVSVVIPSTQRYAKNSYGVGANVMIASSSNNSFTLRNICGWLKLQFTGNAIINAIKIKGNNNEQLAGTAIANYEDFSTFLYGNLANSGDDIGGIILPGGCAREITLDCGTGLMLSDTPTEFYIAVAPQTLSKGISITAECYGNTSKINKSTSKSITIARNHIVPVANIDIDVPVPNKCIIYTSSDGKIVEPKNSAFNATIVSNTYNNGIGMIIFDRNIWGIGNNAFKGCTELTSITIPDSVASIGDSAFSGCSGLTSIKIPPKITSIGDSAFYDCSSLKSTTIGKGVTKIGASAFKGCSGECIINCNIPNKLKSSSIFEYARFTKITIGNSVTSIGDYAFYDCSYLTSIVIPDSVTSIGEDAFLYCSDLNSVYITDIAKWYAIKFGSGSSNPLWCVANLYLNGELFTDLIIPDGITSIGRTFSGCSSLKSVTIPDSVTSIGRSAFSGCNSLTSITIPDGVTSIEDSAFSGCNSLTSINIPNGVTSIGKRAFSNCSSLTNITLPHRVNWIWDYTFSGCSSLTSINIPDSVTDINEGAFSNCSSLTDIILPYRVTHIGWYAFRNCISLTSITIPGGVTSIGYSAFSGCSSLASIYCKPKTPPRLLDSYVFSNISSSAKIYVPTVSVSAYNSETSWRNYRSMIVGYDF